ncbi:hypothetical protein GCK32_013010 [Trichostrongylus colubriformis]|uniref:Uncharacterized protein n=1 Tax=Trichostrongylus colubriformis TaxID=6319 RepID=A0AAN8FEB6_TRICO
MAECRSQLRDYQSAVPFLEIAEYSSFTKGYIAVGILLSFGVVLVFHLKIAIGVTLLHFEFLHISQCQRLSPTCIAYGATVHSSFVHLPCIRCLYILLSSIVYLTTITIIYGQNLICH